MNPDADEPIKVVSYDPSWPRLFEDEACRLRRGISEQVPSMEHCGSTSVAGMVGKPIVDLLFGVHDMDQAYRIASEVEALGYENLGEIFVPRRVYLRHRGPPHFNVLIVIHNGSHWKRWISLRDYLRAHRDEVEAYSQRKLAAVASGATMFLSYSREKGPFLAELAERAERWNADQAHPA